MEKAKLFMNGGSQAVRLPKDCRFEGSEVVVKRVGKVVMLIPEEETWEIMMTGLNGLSEDFLADGIEDLPPEKGDFI